MCCRRDVLEKKLYLPLLFLSLSLSLFGSTAGRSGGGETRGRAPGGGGRRGMFARIRIAFAFCCLDSRLSHVWFSLDSLSMLVRAKEERGVVRTNIERIVNPKRQDQATTRTTSSNHFHPFSPLSSLLHSSRTERILSSLRQNSIVNNEIDLCLSSKSPLLSSEFLTVHHPSFFPRRHHSIPFHCRLLHPRTRSP